MAQVIYCRLLEPSFSPRRQKPALLRTHTAGYSHVALSCAGCTIKCGNAVDRRPERGGPERRHVSTVNARLQSNGTHTPTNVMGGGNTVINKICRDFKSLTDAIGTQLRK